MCILKLNLALKSWVVQLSRWFIGVLWNPEYKSFLGYMYYNYFSCFKTCIFTSVVVGFFWCGLFCCCCLYWICYNIASVLCFGLLAQRHVGSQLSARDRTHTPCIGRQSPNHWTAREVPVVVFFDEQHLLILMKSDLSVFYS